PVLLFLTPSPLVPLPFISLFFFHCSRPPRDLHSFPTRRSSDLSALPRSPGVLVAARATLSSDDRGLEGMKVLLNAEGTGGRLIQDRKSTRLNSSHLVISYAVFCLKKKKKNNIIVNCTGYVVNLY